MIHFNNVSKTYPGGFLALKNVSFELAAGEMAFLTGHSGAGKSTLLKLMSLMEKPTSGKIQINGNEISNIKYKDIPYARRKIGMIFQNHNLLMDRTIFDNVALPLVIEGYSHKETRKRVEAALDKVHLSDKLRCFPNMLSGGEQQRVGIARALVNKPLILLADEPTGNLDPKLSLDIIRLFEEFNDFGVTVLIATHDLGLIARMKYRTLTLKQGSMITDGIVEGLQVRHENNE
ncbi:MULTISPECIES: cell division ATP-binding protein FtsE [unclassified Colwellia]|jgi:cell division transport system ATP-binding protein|uniref:cell division ATP-binding protein FtsE n=1 Tax=unclassified Colwellia TaxID=196834 RepID=UPI0015F4989E|nr:MULTISPECIES: cell division ATP-binding protein FtsE [unclassified Colwellia]MBA6362215.1 cell division ATP-binding protein FtsE [Colwellia sp. BRX8-8]MBA6338248.1 cell division ATP-binding protein FtsE [Colwellia sp. BRX8-7]MBA6347806.1 cell division ATP-binding protein FtsE [Colwellia sp. BRX8-9]MBA6351799.1 cell division ATP-binding protein FtsE [Colwellia sp. BRX9-1]MBA6357050.1 cell division ATP-binding protein FtsE [Colwellia sp. BRX8-3]|tara:strand:- start:2905 stop:3603 length:699 start_codon:yes stop_codon:yes gene_type:complete